MLQRKEITEELYSNRSVTQTSLWDKYSAYEHLAKIEVPKDKDELAELQARLRKRFPVDAYNKAHMELDPNSLKCKVGEAVPSVGACSPSIGTCAQTQREHIELVALCNT